MATQVLILPGWQNSGPEHWQSLWENQHGWLRVPQHDWEHPRRGDWLAQLDATVLDLSPDQPVVFAAHSLGCILVAAWAHHSRHTQRVRGALLVAPGDTETDALRTVLPGWAPIVRDRLPFPSTLVASRNDPFCSWDRSVSLAHDWGCELVDAGERGHLNAASGLGHWPEGQALLAPYL